MCQQDTLGYAPAISAVHISWKAHAEYEAALRLVAEKKGIEYDALIAKILAAGGPASSGTQADNVKFHDDKSLYTGSFCLRFDSSKWSLK